MGLKPFSFIISILISLLPLINGHGHANSPQPLDHKAYLERYGYLEYARANAITNDDESDIIKSAIKTFQENFDIKPTGILDSETLAAMNTPRCGVPDVSNGVNHMQARRNSSKFVINPGNYKWNKTKLSYSLWKGFPEAAKFPLQLAFTQWKVNSHFTFSLNNGPSDMLVGFFRGEHGDGVPFDGPRGVYAHAQPPFPTAFAHFDADENWSYDNVNGTPRNALDFEMVALHEIGHMLGLAHSKVRSAIMYPFMNYGATEVILDDDDIKGIRYLYGP